MTGSEPLPIDIVRGNPTDDEVAALIAVVSAAYQQEAASATVPEAASPSAWMRSVRAPRSVPKPGTRWGGFTGT